VLWDARVRRDLAQWPVWRQHRDRAVKADFTTVDGQTVLVQVASLPIQSWRYRTEDSTVRHIGPMAQDFAAASQMGDDDRHIHVVDGQGVALAAI
jgi:hypothetical protein